MRIRLLAVAVCSVCVGCVSFVPTQSASIYKDLEETNNNLKKVATAIDGIYTGTDSYDRTSGYYVAALAAVSSAKSKAEGRSAYLRGKIAEAPAKKVALAIGNCEASIKKVRARHEAQGVLDPGSLERQSVMETCQIPKTMEELLK